MIEFAKDQWTLIVDVKTQEFRRIYPKPLKKETRTGETEGDFRFYFIFFFDFLNNCTYIICVSRTKMQTLDHW